MPVLNWIGKDKVVDHDKELPFRVLKPVDELSIGKDSENLLIQGDNLEALKALMPFYYNKVKCIYIDPPYNTGNEGWVYNDKVNSPQIKEWLNNVVGAEGEDLCRHDKWLCMMYPRLKLLRDLLSDDGFIFISIDDNELHNLSTIAEEIFGSPNFIARLIWRKRKGGGNDSKFFSIDHEYILCYAKNVSSQANKLRSKHDKEYLKRYSQKDDKGLFYWDTFARAGLVVGDKEKDSLYYDIEAPDGTKITNRWRRSKKQFYEDLKNGEARILKTKNGWGVHIKQRLNEAGQVFRSLILEQSNKDAADEMYEIFGDKKAFSNPKPVDVIKKILEFSTKKDDIVLDTFAGSGTTGHAVLELNKEDGGDRKFILVELEREIAKNVTAKRLKKVIEGYQGAKFPEGTGGGLKYLDLNGKLYDYSGYVNPDAKYEDMSAYIYFTETQKYLDLETIENPYIGSQGSTHYFLFFKNKGDNVLDKETLKKAEAVKGKKVIYADKCLIDEEELERRGIVFKQIPYELKKY